MILGRGGQTAVSNRGAGETSWGRIVETGAIDTRRPVSVVWSIAITSVPSFRRSVTRSHGNRNPKTLLPPRDGWAPGGGTTHRRDGGRLGGREGGLNGYILISFVHPQKLPSVPFRRSRQLVLGLVSFRKEATLCRTQTFANTFVPKLRALIRRGTWTRVPQISVSRVPQKPLARIHLPASISGTITARNPKHEVFCFVSCTNSDVPKYIILGRKNRIFKEKTFKLPRRCEKFFPLINYFLWPGESKFTSRHKIICRFNSPARKKIILSMIY